MVTSPPKYRAVVLAILIGLAGLALLAVLAIAFCYRAIRQPPDFYRQALASTGPALQEQGERFERQALALHNQAHHDGHWQVRFTQDEVNGWLAFEFPAKFPRALPKELSEPRIVIEPELVQVALTYQGEINTVVSVSGDVHLTDEPNEIAIHVKRIRAGLLPVPLAHFKDEIAARVTRTGATFRWSEANGEPVALVRLPPTGDDKHRWVLEQLSSGDRELIVAGRTEQVASPPTADAETGTGQAAVQSAESDTRQR
jgi:hypothetical protein